MVKPLGLGWAKKSAGAGSCETILVVDMAGCSARAVVSSPVSCAFLQSECAGSHAPGCVGARVKRVRGRVGKGWGMARAASDGDSERERACAVRASICWNPTHLASDRVERARERAPEDEIGGLGRFPPRHRSPPRTFVFARVTYPSFVFLTCNRTRLLSPSCAVVPGHQSHRQSNTLDATT